MVCILTKPLAPICLIVFWLALSGCGAREVKVSHHDNPVPSTDLDSAIAGATAQNRPLMVLVVDSGRGEIDVKSAAVFGQALSNEKRVVSLLKDIGNSRDRAMALRYHPGDVPVLVCLTPRGVIVGRSEGALSRELLGDQIAEAVKQSRRLDEQLASLERAVRENTQDLAKQYALAEFLMSRQNAREAIGPLTVVARSASAPAELRSRAWVDLARAHAWVMEPEKARQEARRLVADLGPTMPTAKAGGLLVLGSLDAVAKRSARAREAFEMAIAAAPESDYAKQAREALAKLPAGGK